MPGQGIVAVLEMEQKWGQVRGGQDPDLQGTLVQEPIQVLCPVHLVVVPQQKVHLVERIDVYPVRMEWVQDRTQELEDVPSSLSLQVSIGYPSVLSFSLVK
jgi:hypothetical protein